MHSFSASPPPTRLRAVHNANPTGIHTTLGSRCVLPRTAARRQRLLARATAAVQTTVQADAATKPSLNNGNGSSNGNGKNSASSNGSSQGSFSLADTPGLPREHTSRRGLVNKVQLSTYGDCIGDNMKDLTGFLGRHIRDAVGSIHLLPCYPSSADRGFAPITYQEVDPAQGTWDDVQTLGKEYQLLVELMVNHISPESEQFQDYLEKGDNSQHAEMFVRWDRLWGEGRPTSEDLDKIRTRKPEQPMLRVTLNDGTEVPLWCTFSPQQIDINPFSEPGWAFVEASLRTLCERGAKMIRLDAFGYVTKKPGTKCFMEEPEVWELLQKIKDVAEPYGTQLLCEVHEDYAANLELARRGYWCYDFALPLLMLHAMEFKHAKSLRHWLRVCPRRQITVLDTHDGMGIDDIKGLTPLADTEELQKTVETCLGCSPNYKYIHQPDGSYEEQPHQYNCTYFSAVHRDPAAYLLARAIQFFTPGVPMVYYVGMLAGTNDNKLANETGSGRDINRHRYSVEEAEADIQQPVVQDLLALCRFRNSFPAFQGSFSLDSAVDAEGGGDATVCDGQGIYPDSEHVLRIGWQQGTFAVQLTADVEAKTFEIRYTTHFGVTGHPDDESDDGLFEAHKVQQKREDGSGGLRLEQEAHVGDLVHVEDAIGEAQEAAAGQKHVDYTDETSSSNEDTAPDESEEEELGALEDMMAAGQDAGVVQKAGGISKERSAKRPQLMAATADTNEWNLLVLPGLCGDKSRIPVSANSRAS